MTQPLNYTPKAIEALLSFPCPGAPGVAAGMRYLAEKLREAQVFVLADHGMLLDRSKPRPQVPGDILRPPFPVVALEYSAAQLDWGEGYYTGAKCSRRIALAWEWQDDLPPALARYQVADLQPGIVVASIPFYDAEQRWIPIPAALHIAFDAEWLQQPIVTPFKQQMLETGRLTKTQVGSAVMAVTPMAMLPEACDGLAMSLGMAGALDTLSADTMDEANAYIDLCYALACKNVETRSRPAPTALNKQRIKAGKLPLKGFHVLELNGGGEMPGGALGDGHNRSAARSHLRRGHIRRLGADRVTWVNSTVVRGRGFIDKVYAA